MYFRPWNIEHHETVNLLNFCDLYYHFLLKTVGHLDYFHSLWKPFGPLDLSLPPKILWSSRSIISSVRSLLLSNYHFLWKTFGRLDLSLPLKTLWSSRFITSSEKKLWSSRYITSSEKPFIWSSRLITSSERPKAKLFLSIYHFLWEIIARFDIVSIERKLSRTSHKLDSLGLRLTRIIDSSIECEYNGNSACKFLSMEIIVNSPLETHSMASSAFITLVYQISQTWCNNNKLTEI